MRALIITVLYLVFFVCLAGADPDYSDRGFNVGERYSFELITNQNSVSPANFKGLQIGTYLNESAFYVQQGQKFELTVLAEPEGELVKVQYSDQARESDILMRYGPKGGIFITTDWEYYVSELLDGTREKEQETINHNFLIGKTDDEFIFQQSFTTDPEEAEPEATIIKQDYELRYELSTGILLYQNLFAQFLTRDGGEGSIQTKLQREGYSYIPAEQLEVHSFEDTNRLFVDINLTSAVLSYCTLLIYRKRRKYASYKMS